MGTELSRINKSRSTLPGERNYSIYVDESLRGQDNFDFEEWAKNSEFTNATVKLLKKQDLTTLSALLLLKSEDIRSLGLTVGETVRLEKAVTWIREVTTELRASEAQKQGSRPDDSGNEEHDGGRPYDCVPMYEPAVDPSDSHRMSESALLIEIDEDADTEQQTSDAQQDAYMKMTPHSLEVNHYENLGKAEGKVMIRALFDYESMEDDELSFKKDDLMELLQDKGDWWLARRIDGSEGYVPYNFVALNNTLKSMNWFFGKMSRHESEQALRAATSGAGSFLVRESLRGNGLVLSVRQSDDDSGELAHYQIHGDLKSGYYISTSQVFRTVENLINYHKEVQLYLVCCLTTPCPKLRPVQQDLSKETEDEWEIDPSTVIFDETLGAGQFGEVLKGKWKEKTVVAVKKMKETMEPTEFLAEAAIMKKFKHPNLVKLYAVCTKQKPYLIVMEHMSNGSLRKYLRDDDNGSLGVTDLIDMAAQVADGMAYLEVNRFIHRDLAARNILVGERQNVKVSDFGFARLLKDTVYTLKEGTQVPYRWTAPEVFTKNRFTIKSDVWSFGILLHEIMTKGEVPYCGMANHDVAEQVKRGFRLQQSEKVPDRVYDVMLRCWDKDENHRPSFKTLRLFLLEYFDDDYTYTAR